MSQREHPDLELAWHNADDTQTRLAILKVMHDETREDVKRGEDAITELSSHFKPKGLVVEMSAQLGKIQLIGTLIVVGLPAFWVLLTTVVGFVWWFATRVPH